MPMHVTLGVQLDNKSIMCRGQLMISSGSGLYTVCAKGELLLSGSEVGLGFNQADAKCWSATSQRHLMSADQPSASDVQNTVSRAQLPTGSPFGSSPNSSPLPIPSLSAGRAPAARRP